VVYRSIFVASKLLFLLLLFLDQAAERDVALLSFKYEVVLDVKALLPPPEFDVWACAHAGLPPPPSEGDQNGGGGGSKPGTPGAAAAAAKKGGKGAPPPADEPAPGLEDGDKAVQLLRVNDAALGALPSGDSSGGLSRCRAAGWATLRALATTPEWQLPTRKLRWEALCEAIGSGADPASRPLRDGLEGPPSLVSSSLDGPVAAAAAAAADGSADPEAQEQLAAAAGRRRRLAYAALAMVLPLPQQTVAANKDDKGQAGAATTAGAIASASANEATASELDASLPPLPVNTQGLTGDLEVRPAQVCTLLLELVRLQEWRAASTLIALAHTWLDRAEDVAAMAVFDRTGGAAVMASAALDGNLGEVDGGAAAAEETEEEVLYPLKPPVISLALPTSGNDASDAAVGFSTASVAAAERELLAQQLELVGCLVRVRYWQGANEPKDLVLQGLADQAAESAAAAAVADKTAAEGGDDAGEATAAAAAGVAAEVNSSDLIGGGNGGIDDDFGLLEEENEDGEDGSTMSGMPSWTLYDEMPELKCFGPKSIMDENNARSSSSGVTEVPVNYALTLCATLSYQGLLGARRDPASGAGALADAEGAVSAGAGLGGEGVGGTAAGGAGGTPTWTLSTHAVDLVADASLFLWRTVCLPMLQQLDEAPATNPTSQHNAKNGATATAAAEKGGGPNFGSQFAPESVSLGIGGQNNHKGATNNENMADALDVNLLVRRCVADRLLGCL